jgi:hypothetical protein
MQKIPTVFRRDPLDMRHVLDEVNPECQWVLDGEGIPRRLHDGSTVMYDGSYWWFEVILDGDSVGPAWIRTYPEHPLAAALVEAIEVEQKIEDEPVQPGTFELAGPSINDNPERHHTHVLFRHDTAEPLGSGIGRRGCRSRSFEALRESLWFLDRIRIAGVVFCHPDGRMAKLAGRDFRAGE